MTKTTGRVLRSDDVRFEGRLHLDTEQGGGGQLNEKRLRVEPTARIAEKGTDFAVIEVICGCGMKIHLRCEYAGG